ncbi:MAG: SPASM domain-containing protein [Candidatus Saganbacteria bacterium]|nr:SPASM domain-containing protein [Candidatus Saganbacteria bacterium]
MGNKFLKPIAALMKKNRFTAAILAGTKKLLKKARLFVSRMTRLRYPDFPKEIWIENTSYCNARCIMCPRDSMTRQRGFMDLGLYEKLIKEISAYPVERLHMHNFGEPLMDKKLPDRIKLAKDHGVKYTYMVTNASLFSPEMAIGIIKAGLDEFKISFYGTDAKTYSETMRGLNFNKTIEGIKAFFEERKRLGARNPRVIIQYLPVDSDQSKVRDFEAIFKPLIDEELGDRLNICELHNFGGGKEYNRLGEISSICHFPWQTMVILQDGKVTTCCIDYDGKQIMGDVNKDSIRDIWNGKAFNRMRRDFRRLDYRKYPICLNCEVIR